MQLDQKMQRELKRKRLMEAILITFYLYAFFGGWLYFKQRDFMYFPDRTPTNMAAAGANAVTVQAADGTGLMGWYIEPQPGKPIAILFHGNAGNVSSRLFKAAPFTDRGMGFLFAEYRGYGGNPGKPTETGLYEDARAWTMALQKEGVPVEQVILYGESLGTGVAVKMAAERPGYRAMILESPFTSFPAIVQDRYPVYPARMMVHDKYDSLSRIDKIKVPTLIIHGRKDMLVPLEQGAQLANAAGGKAQLVVLDNAGHGNLYQNGAPEVIGRFLDEMLK